jgi:hypothetical protein
MGWPPAEYSELDLQFHPAICKAVAAIRRASAKRSLKCRAPRARSARISGWRLSAIFGVGADEIRVRRPFTESQKPVIQAYPTCLIVKSPGGKLVGWSERIRVRAFPRVRANSGILSRVHRHDEGGFDRRRKIGLPNFYSEVPFTGFRGKAARIAFPDDPRMFQHIDPVGMRKCESNVLLAEQHRNRRCLAQLLQCF